MHDLSSLALHILLVHKLIAEYLRGNGVHLVHCLKVASKLFYSSLHAGYFAFFCRRHVFFIHCSFQKHQSVKSHQGYFWVETVQII